MGRICEYSIEEQRILFPEKFINNNTYEEDYKRKTGRNVKKTIKRSLKDSNDVFDILDSIYDGFKNLADLLVFDISHVSDKKVNEIRDLFKSHQFGYSELGVYGDDIIFAAMDVEMEGK
jgi:hypothetical protein